MKQQSPHRHSRGPANDADRAQLTTTVRPIGGSPFENLDCIHALAILRARAEHPKIIGHLKSERRRRFSYLDQQELEAIAAVCREAGEVE